MKHAKPWKIVDWAGNDVNTGGKTFETFLDTWDWIYLNCSEEDFEDLFAEHEDFGICDDRPENAHGAD